MRMLSPLYLLVPCLALASCSDDPSQLALSPPPIIADTKPLGDGLKVIGFALLGASVVLTLGRLLR